MASLSEVELSAVLREVIGPEDEIVWLAGGIWTFAHAFRWKRDEVATRILDVVLDVLGPTRTLIISSYTFAYAGTRRYDLVRTKPETGILPLTALRHPAFQRTPQPINNYLVAGPRAAEIRALPCSTSWGDDSLMGWAEKVGARVCILGVPWHEACSLYHRAEAKLGAPYRYYKSFPGVMLRDGVELGHCSETLFVCSRTVRPNFDWRSIRPLIPQFGQVKQSTNPAIFAESACAKAIVKATEAILERDPYGLLTNPTEIAQWVSCDRLSEIATLLPSDYSPLNAILLK